MTFDRCAYLAVLAVMMLPVVYAKKDRSPERSPLDRYVEEATARAGKGNGGSAPGSVWSPSARFADTARDVRAESTDDVVTILVVERASAVAKGSTKSGRASSMRSSLGALGGITRAAGPLANLASVGGESQLNGEGSTSRETLLSTTVAARVTHVLPNGLLVVEGAKYLQVNSEQQTVTVRGVVRPEDLNPGNVVRSDRISQLEVRINGKGVVGDAVRRPFFLYRLLQGLLPL